MAATLGPLVSLAPVGSPFDGGRSGAEGGMNGQVEGHVHKSFVQALMQTPN